MAPLSYLVIYSADFLQKKTKVLETFNTHKICFMNILIFDRYRVRPSEDMNKGASNMSRIKGF